MLVAPGGRLLKKLQAIRKPPFHRTPEAAKAFVVIPVCEARLAMLAGNWPEAQVQVRKAGDNLKELKRLAKRGTDLETFSQAFSDDVDNVETDVQNEWEFGVALTQAEELFQRKDYAGAIRIVEGQLTTRSL